VHDAGFDFRTVAPPANSSESDGTGRDNSEKHRTSGVRQCQYGANRAPNIPGCSLTLAKAGQYLIYGVFDLGSYDANVYLVGGLNGSTPLALLLTNETGFRATVAQQWAITASAGFVAQLAAYKGGGTAGSLVSVGNTSITAVWIAP
jgi:hypothetical protein